RGSPPARDPGRKGPDEPVLAILRRSRSHRYTRPASAWFARGRGLASSRIRRRPAPFLIGTTPAVVLESTSMRSVAPEEWAMSSRGLEGVVVAQTELSRIDGEKGRLIYRGYEIEDLAEHATFEEVCHLLWFGELPNEKQLADLRAKLAEAREVHPDIIEMLRRLPKDTHPMAALRTAASMLASYDPDAEDMSDEANVRKAIRLTAQLSTLTAAFARLREGKEPVAPRTDLGLAANFLYMLTGEEPDELASRIMDVAFILHA